MFKRTASLLGLSVLAACSASSGETAESSHQALSLTFGSLSVTPTDTTITIAYEEPGTTPLAVTLGGKTITATYNPSGTPQNQSVAFTGLQPCTSYGWSIPTPSGAVTGQTNTRWTGNTACAATNVILPSQWGGFVGAEHQEQNNFGCGTGSLPWNSTWPVGSQWTSPAILDQSAAHAGVEFGYSHYSNGSSWCAESTVEAWRGKLTFDIVPTQTARGVTKAVLSASYVSSGNALPANNPVCSPNLAYLVEQPWPEPNDADVGTWESILGGGVNPYALVPTSFTFPIVATGHAVSAAESVGTITSQVYNDPVPLQSSFIATGFAATNDGFADLMAGEAQTWAADDNSCRTTLSDVAMTLTFQPLPPETPICTAAISCNSATVTCAASPETFQLETTSTGAVLATFDGTGGAAPAFTVPNTGVTDSYTACTVNSAGATACAPVTFVSDVACPACVVTTQCEGSCGTLPDNCGGTIACGGCPAGLVCSNYNACQKCAVTTSCPPTEYFNESTCACARNSCACGGVYPACKVCQ